MPDFQCVDRHKYNPFLFQHLAMQTLTDASERCGQHVMVEQLTLKYLATALVDIPAGCMPIACSLKT